MLGVGCPQIKCEYYTSLVDAFPRSTCVCVLSLSRHMAEMLSVGNDEGCADCPAAVMIMQKSLCGNSTGN